MALMAYLNIVIQILWSKIMPAVGVLAVVGYGLIKVGHKIPLASAREKLGTRILGQGSRILGKTLIAIKNEDGLWTIKPGSYDEENNGYWVPTDSGREFYDAAGVGGDPGGWYGGTSLAVAYDGLGALAEVASGEVGRQARIKKQTFKEDLSKLEQGEQLIASAGKEIAGTLGGKVREATRSDDEAVTDGGKELVEEWQTMLPEKKVVDLRDTLHNAPFHVQPQQFHRVAENAKEGQRGFAKLGPVGQAGIIMMAFMLGGIVTYIGFTAAGSGGGAMKLPLTALPALGVM